MPEETRKEPITLSDVRIETLETLRPLSLSADQTYGRTNNNNPFDNYYGMPNHHGSTNITHRKGKKTMETLLHNIKPKLFLPKKNLNLDKFKNVLIKLGLFEFTRIKFDPVIRVEYLAELVSNYNPRKKCSYVGRFRISLTKNDLARALKLPVKKPENGAANIKDVVDLDSRVYSDEEIAFIEDFAINWMLVSDKDMVTLGEVAKWLTCIRDGRLDKIDTAEFIWYRVEKELTQGEKLVECYHASHLQCLIQSQHPHLFVEDYVGVGVSNKAVKDMSNENSGDKGRSRPQPIVQVEPVKPVPYTDTVISLSSDESANEARAAKRLKSTSVENLGNMTDRELLDYIWTNKRNVGNLERYLPEKAVAVKKTIKCYEDEIERRARLQSPKASTQDTCAELEKVSCVLPMLSSPDKFYTQGNSLDEVAEKAKHWNFLQASTQDTCTELEKVSCILSMLSSPDKSYAPQGDPLDEEAEKAKQTLIELLNKNFESIVRSPDEERVKSCITILTTNVHKLPRFQGRVIEALNTEFNAACENWKMWHTNRQLNIAFEVQQGDNLRVLKDWQERHMEIKSKIERVHADILRLKAELREKELTHESLVKQKSNLFNQSKMSIDEAKNLLQEMVAAKLLSDVAVDNMNELETKWKRARENFKMKQG